jgi:ATP-dependent helicase/nuclease subunit A
MREPEDFKYRKMIGENLDVSMLVDAGAGSGKTMSLVNRMLALIGSGKTTVDRMAAVTFTRKAAAEMKSRFQISLEKAVDQETDGKKKERFQSALDHMEFLFSGTIHSFCGRLLRERPIEARLDPDFRELEEDENALLRDSCWSEYLEGLQGEGTETLKAVLDLGINPAELLQTYQGITLFPEVEVFRKKIDPPDYKKEKGQIRKYLEVAGNSLPKTVPDKGWDPLQDLLRQVFRQVRYLDLDKDLDFIEILQGLNRSVKVTLYKWPSNEVAKEQQALFEPLKKDVILPSLKRWNEYRHFFVMELIAPAVEYFERARKLNSQLNFYDLLLQAAMLLRENPEVRQYFQERFTHILVDEFQDTDPVQAEVVLYLTGEDLKEKAWQKIRVKPGSLFIVGDPKQSIYRFRRADIDTYNEVKRVIKKSGGLIIPLTTNFRSVPGLCDWINPIFKEKLPAQGTSYQAPFDPLVPFQEAKAGGVKRISIDKVKGHKETKIAAQDAVRIASWVDWAIRGNFKIVRTEEERADGKSETAGPGDFMILLRYKKHLPVYARALEAYGIPYEISGGGGFKESEEILHLLQLLSAVANPEDQIALVATLRGPFFGISDDMLYRFRNGGGRFHFPASQDRCKDKEAKERVFAVFTELQEFHQWARTKPPGAVLSKILDRLGLVPLAVTREMGESRTGNLLKMLEIAFSESSKGITSFEEMVERLHQYFAEVEVEEMSVEPGKKDVARLMNLHKAKGLEAPVVFLADPLREPTHDPDYHIDRTGKVTGFFVAAQGKGEHQKEIVGIPLEWDRYAETEQKYRDAEEDRLLYVAATRAKQLLVVSRYPEKTEKGAWSSLYPYLESVHELEQPEPQERFFEKSDISRKAFEASKGVVSKTIEKGKQATYETVSVTAEAKDPARERPFVDQSGQGMSWGRIIHRMLEALANGKSVDIDLLAENLLREEERPRSEKELIVPLVQAVLSSDLWQRAKAAEKSLVEVPFSYTILEGKVPKVVSGTVDLAFREKDGWVIADYKSDKIDGNMDALIAYYRPQVEMYREFWEKISGEKVKEAGLYFIDARKWVIV